MTAPFSLTVAEVAAACEGRLFAGDPTEAFRSVSIDTRSLRPGDAFVALPGPRFDGHHFVADAVARGASAVLVSSADAATNARARGVTAILVADTLHALQSLARHVRRLSGAQVVAITGSAGKTTTKEATAALLSLRYRTMRTRGNLNNHIGLPLSLLDLQHGDEIAVVELGMNHAGEIARLVAIAEPDVCVWTNVGTAHLAFFESIDAIAEAKAEVLQGAGADTVFVANADDPRVCARIPGFPGRVMTFGLDRPADVQAIAVESRGVEGQDAFVRTSAGDVRLTLQLAGRAQLANVLAAMAVALYFAVPMGDLVQGISTLRAASHRGELVRLARGIRLVDDCYNSSPGALRQALDVVATTPVVAARVAVLGEMLELGDRSEALHRECGHAVAEAGVGRLVTVGGPAAQALARSAVDGGLSPDVVRHVADSEAAVRLLKTTVQDGDLVLVKGSRGIRLDLVVEYLKTEFA